MIKCGPLNENVEDRALAPATRKKGREGSEETPAWLLFSAQDQGDGTQNTHDLSGTEGIAKEKGRYVGGELSSVCLSWLKSREDFR